VLAGFRHGFNVHRHPEFGAVRIVHAGRDRFQWIRDIVIAVIQIRISFEDDGPGVPEDALPALFEAFYRGDQSRRNSNQGSGLGLAITQKAVERMDGRIYAENREQGGLRIVVEIPEMKESQ